MGDVSGFLVLLASGGGSNWTFAIILYAVVIGGGYFLLIRPQRKEKKRLQAMYSEMAIGDTAVTTSGFYGVLIDITAEDVIVEFGNNKNCRIPMKKSAIAQIEKAENVE